MGRRKVLPWVCLESCSYPDTVRVSIIGSRSVFDLNMALPCHGYLYTEVPPWG